MKVVFADTFYFLALLNRRDRHHRAAVEFSRTSLASLVTTQWVLVEVGNALARGVNRSLFEALVETLQHSPRDVVIPATDDSFNAGVELYGQRADKSWSVTDCISFVVMQERQIEDALTGDHHFEQAGFRVLLK